MPAAAWCLQRHHLQHSVDGRLYFRFRSRLLRLKETLTESGAREDPRKTQLARQWWDEAGARITRASSEERFQATERSRRFDHGTAADHASFQSGIASTRKLDQNNMFRKPGWPPVISSSALYQERNKLRQQPTNLSAQFPLRSRQPTNQPEPINNHPRRITTASHQVGMAGDCFRGGQFCL